jgi:2-keto-4-pentenoate hydratase
MEQSVIERAARILHEARVSDAKIDGLPAACRPCDIDDAYKIQDALLAMLGKPSKGWFLACTAPAMQQAHGLPGPYFGRMLGDAILDSPAEVPVPADRPQSLEIELVFRLGADLPPRAKPYMRDEIAAAVAAMHPGIEIVEGRFTDLLTIDGPTLVADNGTDGILVLGPPCPDWRDLNRSGLAVSLTKDGVEASGGSGGNVMGDPLNALVWCANELSRRGLGLKAGETLNTGNALDRYTFGMAGERIVADCGLFGRAECLLVERPPIR